MIEETNKKIPKKSKLERITAIKYKRAKDTLERKTKAIMKNKNGLLQKIMKISAIAALPLPISASDNVNHEADATFLNPENKIENTQGVKSSGGFEVYNSAEDFYAAETNKQAQMQAQLDSAFDAYIQERQQGFYEGMYDRLSNNIRSLQNAKKGKAAVLRQLYGKGVNVRFYCAYASISAMNQTAQEIGYMEFAYLNKCIDNIHYCPSVVSGLKENVNLRDFDQKINSYLNSLPASSETKNLTDFLNAVKKHVHKSPTTQSCRDVAAYMESLGNETLSDEDRQQLFAEAKKALGVPGLKALDQEKIGNEGMALLQDCANSLNKPRQVVETNNLLEEIRSQLQDNPNSVLLVVHKSSGNHTGSGLHAVTVMRDKNNPEEIKVFSQNGEHIDKAEDYFLGKESVRNKPGRRPIKNIGTVANVSESGSQDFRDNEYAKFVQHYRLNQIRDEMLLASADGWREISNIEAVVQIKPKEIKPLNLAIAAKDKIYRN